MMIICKLEENDDIEGDILKICSLFKSRLLLNGGNTREKTTTKRMFEEKGLFKEERVIIFGKCKYSTVLLTGNQPLFLCLIE